MQDATKHYINGAWVASIDGNEMAVENPSSKEQIATISLGSPADADAARCCSQGRFSGMGGDRAPRTHRRAGTVDGDAYKARAGEMAQAISNEMGAPIALAETVQVGAGAGHFKNTIRAARGFAFERPLGDHTPGDMILYEPVGGLRTDHPLELADEPGYAQGGADSGGGMHRGSETLGTGTAQAPCCLPR